MSTGFKKFIADDMLGKLAARLRLLGFDTTYYGNSEDSFLLRQARAEGRILLTRDRGLTMIRGANAFFVTSRKLIDQLKEVIAHFGLKIDRQQLFTRCSVCNVPLQPVEKAKVRTKVPPLVFRLFTEFSHCPQCGRYYWPGTHYNKIAADLGGLLEV